MLSIADALMLFLMPSTRKNPLSYISLSFHFQHLPLLFPPKSRCHALCLCLSFSWEMKFACKFRDRMLVGWLSFREEKQG
jgi:hypothetical protein